MTIAEKLRQEGHHNGLQEGWLKGTREEALRIARMMLERGIDHETVLTITGFSADDVTEYHH